MKGCDILHGDLELQAVSFAVRQHDQQTTIKDRTGPLQGHGPPHLEIDQTDGDPPRSWTNTAQQGRLPIRKVPATARSQIRRPYAARFVLLGCELVGRMHIQPSIRPISMGLTSREAQSWQRRLVPGRLGTTLSLSGHACP